MRYKIIIESEMSLSDVEDDVLRVLEDKYNVVEVNYENS